MQTSTREQAERDQLVRAHKDVEATNRLADNEDFAGYYLRRLDEKIAAAERKVHRDHKNMTDIELRAVLCHLDGLREAREFPAIDRAGAIAVLKAGGVAE
jgi:hypothetical protein